jgi:alkylation response protein AidB-like acyl-CoA dehydrogenase
MDLALSDEQEQLVDSFADLFAKQAAPERVRAAEPLGHDAVLWDTLVATGTTAMAVAEDAGGWGASLLDLALVAELAGRAIAPAPLIETQVAARLLASLSSPEAAAVLEQTLAGSAITTLAVRPSRGGRLGLVPAGAVAQTVVALDGDRLVALPAAAQSPRPVENLGSQPLADLAITDDAVVLAQGEPALAAFDHAIDEWLVLTAAAVTGMGARALEIASEYVTERRAWGVPIGTFQAVSHPIANSATALDGARLLGHKAAWAADVGDARAAELAAMAFAFACESANDATYHAVHVHGGYGFMLEYDVQLHYRRARGWARVWGEPRTAYRRAAARRYQKRLA